MTRNKTILTFLLAMMTVLLAGAPEASAESKTMVLGWDSDHWKEQYFQPLLMPPKQTHDRQWDFKEDWSPEDWIAKRGGGELMTGFFKADILRERDVKNDIPVLVVGSNFYRLSGYDKRRVTDVVNAVHDITGTSEAGHFRLRDGQTGEWIGYYDSHGLRLR